MPLRIDADITLSIHGQPASLRASGQQLQLKLSNMRTLLAMRADAMALSRAIGIMLPQTSTEQSIQGFITGLVREGLTLDIVDDKGSVLRLGHAVASSRLWLPSVGRFEGIAFTGWQGFLRLLRKLLLPS